VRRISVRHSHNVAYGLSLGNHTAYKQFKGRRTPADEIEELYEGLKQSDLNNFDMMLSGYIASKDAVKTVGQIGRDLRLRANIKPGSFFWCKFVDEPIWRQRFTDDLAQASIPLWVTKGASMSQKTLCLPIAFSSRTPT